MDKYTGPACQKKKQQQSLKTFSKIYQLAIKNQIAVGTRKYLSPLISAYRKGYDTQHAITKLIKDWRET